MSAQRTKLFLVVGALGLSVLLFIAPKVAPENAAKKRMEAKTSFQNASLEVFLTMASKTLDPETKKRLDLFTKKNMQDSAAEIWYALKRPDLASYYHELDAQKSNSTESWLKAGTRYYYAVKFTQDETEVPLLYQCAMRCFNKVLNLDSRNSKAKILLASCYVEGTEKPMDGITLLREVEKTDSNNVDLQLAFASFSMKSGQLDKAISRFNKVAKIDSSYVEVYLHLADAYERMGQTQLTIDMLERYRDKTTDATAKMEVDKYIQQLKTNINK